MADLGKLMKQAREMQQQLSRLQAELEKLEVEGSSGGGMVSVTVNGKKDLLSLTIQPEVVNRDDIPMLEDLIRAAIKQAQEKVEAASRERLGNMTGGLSLPGLGL